MTIHTTEQDTHHLESPEQVENYVNTARTQITKFLSPDSVRATDLGEAIVFAEVTARELSNFSHSEQAELFTNIAETIKQIKEKHTNENGNELIAGELDRLENKLKELLGTNDIKV